MRCTLAGLTPWALAIERVLQCVCPGGVLWFVAVTISLTFWAEIVRFFPRPSFTSESAWDPPSAKRRRHMITVGRLCQRSGDCTVGLTIGSHRRDSRPRGDALWCAVRSYPALKQRSLLRRDLRGGATAMPRRYNSLVYL